MPNIKYVNDQLAHYLAKDKREFGDYSKLIEYIMKDDAPVHAKYNLLCLLMNHGTEKIANENLARSFRTLHSSDPDIQAFLKERVWYSPKLGKVELEAKHDNNGCLSFKVDYDKDIDQQFKNANAVIERVKRVITQIIVESRTVPIEEVSTEKSES